MTFPYSWSNSYNQYTPNNVYPYTTNCVSSIEQGKTATIKLEVTGGQPSYLYEIFIDNVLASSSTSSALSYTFTKLINYAVGTSHTIVGKVTDSCGTPQVKSETCTITVTAPSCPALTASLECPTKTSFAAGDIVPLRVTGVGGSGALSIKYFRNNNTTPFHIASNIILPYTTNYTVTLADAGTNVQLNAKVEDSCALKQVAQTNTCILSVCSTLTAHLTVL